VAVGVAPYPISGGPGTKVSIALVDGSSGAILWFDVAQGVFDLKNPEQATKLVEQAFKDFPRKSKDR
jgi:hypothetical protein